MTWMSRNLPFRKMTKFLNCAKFTPPIPVSAISVFDQSLRLHQTRCVKINPFRKQRSISNSIARSTSTSEVRTEADLDDVLVATVGIETHVQLKTKTKCFCACPNLYGQAPNTLVCPVCLGHPGTLPVFNKQVVDFAILSSWSLV